MGTQQSPEFARELANKLKRKEKTLRCSLHAKKVLNGIFDELVLHRHIVDYEPVYENFQLSYMVFHIKYECTIIAPAKSTVTISFNVDIRELTKTCIEKATNSHESKFLLSSGFDRSALFARLQKRLIQWKNGLRNESCFMDFLTSLKESCPRIYQIYKTNDHADGKDGIDFVVSFFSKPYYECNVVKFNLKSSGYFLDKHKARHPNVSTFIFTRKTDLEDIKSLKKRFLTFLLLVPIQKVVHM